MIPLRDVIPSRTTPYITITIIGLNALAWFYELSLPENVLPRFLNGLPTRFEVGDGPVVLNATQVDIDPATGRALAIERIQQVWEG